MRNANIDNAIARSLSRDRLDKYLQSAGSNLDLALGLYERNTRLAEAFYTPLQAMEICLRNHMNIHLAAVYGGDWMTNGVPPLNGGAEAAIQRAVADLRQTKVQPTPGAIVAELSFGFWVSLLGRGYDATVWRFAVSRAFRENGKGMRRDRVHGRFNMLRRFRNRVAHHEPIFQQDLDERHREALEAMTWMCPDTAAWAEYHSRFPAVFAAP